MKSSVFSSVPMYSHEYSTEWCLQLPAVHTCTLLPGTLSPHSTTHGGQSWDSIQPVLSWTGCPRCFPTENSHTVWSIPREPAAALPPCPPTVAGCSSRCSSLKHSPTYRIRVLAVNSAGTNASEDMVEVCPGIDIQSGMYLCSCCVHCICVCLHLCDLRVCVCVCVCVCFVCVCGVCVCVCVCVCCVCVCVFVYLL